jgi:hypothetical protein
MTMHPEWF